MEKIKIDEFFKERLDLADISFNETHWDEMERLMVQRQRRRRLKEVALFSSGIAAVAAMLLVVYYVYFDMPTSSIDHAIVHHHEKKIPKINKYDQSTDNNFWLDESLTENNPKPSKPNSNVRSAIAKFKKYGEAAILNHPLGNELSDEIMPIEHNEIIASGKDQLALIDKEEVKIANNEIENKKQVEQIISNKDEIIQPIESSEVEKPRKLIGTLSLLGAPDLTSVRGANQSSWSQNIGLLYTQPISKRLSLSTGMLYAKKNYNAPFNLYNPKNAVRSSYISGDINAVCDVIDIPILLNFKFYENRKFSFQAGAGLSNYFMIKENYQFTYNQAGNYGYESKDGSYTFRNENRHWFGVADFSLSIDHKINNRFSIGLRPFIKVPLTGIGYGRVKLESKGVAVTVGYSLFK